MSLEEHTRPAAKHSKHFGISMCVTWSACCMASIFIYHDLALRHTTKVVLVTRTSYITWII